jgi:hypothetical protein
MKSITKQLLIAAAAVLVAAPAVAAEVTKGTKSYQTRTEKPADVASAATPEDVADIAPAAGDTDTTIKKEKSLKEEIRLPRK